ncbi:hypothetical protein AN958_00956 [Leucoagaricus sp. SymC.cos]|nr:hypothetical protein AN958_00956 [Leucoagaricus sp. SymC.cos]
MWKPFSLTSVLLELPAELIDRILCNLDLRSLLTCKQVCKNLKQRIENGKGIQYIMELEINGLEMNPNNKWSATDCFDCLQKYRSAWQDLEGLGEKPMVVPMRNGGLWELYGGVLAQKDREGIFHFSRLPSGIRHIEEETWQVKPDIQGIRDFGMDPSQDLLVWITAPSNSAPLSLHLRTLKKAEQHPRARHDVIRHDRCTAAGRWHFSIKIMQDYIGLWAYMRTQGDSDATHDITEFYVWNWKEDKLELDITTKSTQSFAFISDRHVVLADRYVSEDLETTDGYLTLIDFKAEDSTKKSLGEVSNSMKLCYPTIKDEIVYQSFNIASEPNPGWTPGQDDRAPFFVAKENRIFTVSMTLSHLEGRDKAFDHFIPLAAFKKCLTRLNTSKARSLPWSEWAPKETRMIRALPASEVWVCFVQGSRSIAASYRRIREEGGGQSQKFFANVYDFNQLALRREKAVGSVLPKHCERVDDTREALDINGIWTENVETSLPYRLYSRNISGTPLGFYYLMCTADHLVLVDSEKKEYQVFSV